MTLSMNFTPSPRIMRKNMFFLLRYKWYRIATCVEYGLPTSTIVSCREMKRYATRKRSMYRYHKRYIACDGNALESKVRGFMR